MPRGVYEYMVGLTRQSLRFTLVIYVVVPLVIVSVIAGYVALRTLESAIEVRMQEDVELVGRAVRLPLSRDIEHGSAGGVERTLRSVFSIHRVYGAYVYDAEGRQVAAAGVQDPLPEHQRLSRLAADATRTGEYGKIGEREVYSYFLPLTDSGGRINGLLQISRRKSDIENYIRGLRIQAVALLIGACSVMAGLIVYGHHGAVGRHLLRLGTSMVRIQGGDRRHRASIEGPREIRSLSMAMNNMLDSIERTEQELAERRVEQTALENQLRQAQTLAAIGRLAAGVAHELGTPLSIVHGKAQRALRSADIPARFRTVLEEIRVELRRMEDIVRQFLDFGRRDSDRRRKVGVDRLARTSAAFVKDEGCKNDVSVELIGPVPAPELAVDPVRIEQALINLLRNAIQATGDGGRVILSWAVTDRTVEFRVEDDGPGISDEIAPRIFEPFFSTKAKGQGTGLGLAVVHAVAEEHGGRLEIGRSRFGGAAFSLLLPQHAGSAQTSSA